MAELAKRLKIFPVSYCYLLKRPVAYRCLNVVLDLKGGRVLPVDVLLPGVVTANEAAKYLRVSKATLLRLTNKGLILGVRIGRQWRFSRKTIQSLLSHPEWLQKSVKS